jgi:hypothetical protein
MEQDFVFRSILNEGALRYNVNRYLEKELKRKVLKDIDLLFKTQRIMQDELKILQDLVNSLRKDVLELRKQ